MRPLRCALKPSSKLSVECSDEMQNSARYLDFPSDVHFFRFWPVKEDTVLQAVQALSQRADATE